MNLAMILMESMATRLKDAGINTLICICVVFAVLIFISLVISLFSFIPKAEAAVARKKARKIDAVSTDGFVVRSIRKVRR